MSTPNPSTPPPPQNSRQGTGSGFDREVWRRQLSPLLTLWDKLMKDNTDVIKPAARDVKSVRGEAGRQAGRRHFCS